MTSTGRHVKISRSFEILFSCAIIKQLIHHNCQRCTNSIKGKYILKNTFYFKKLLLKIMEQSGVKFKNNKQIDLSL